MFVFAVFGWFQDSFVGLEQELAHTLEAGYLKGAEVAEVNISVNLDVMSQSPGPDMSNNSNSSHINKDYRDSWPLCNVLEYP